MSTTGSGREWTTMSVRPSTHRRVEALKRGGDTFDDVLLKMAAQYDPDAATPGKDA